MYKDWLLGLLFKDLEGFTFVGPPHLAGLGVLRSKRGTVTPKAGHKLLVVPS